MQIVHSDETIARRATLRAAENQPQGSLLRHLPGLRWLALSGEQQPGLDHGIRIQRHAFDLLPDQPLRKLGIVRGSLSANATIAILLATRSDREREHGFDGIVALVEGRRDRA